MNVESTENLSEIGDEQELLQYLNKDEDDNKGAPVVENKNVDDSSQKSESEKIVGDDVLPVATNAIFTKAQDNVNAVNDDEKKDDDDTDTDDDKTSQEFGNIVEYLNTTHELGLKIDELPEDLTREQEAEVVAELFNKVATGASKQVEEYKEIATLLEDEEVAAFIQAKKQGVTLRDFIDAVKDTPTNMSDEEIIKSNIHAQYPSVTDDELNDLVEDYKTKGILTKMAETARTRMTEVEAQTKENDIKQEQQDYHKNVNEIGEMLEGTTEVYGVPLTNEIKKNVFIAATQRDNDSGLTYLDKALQSNEGVLLATLGLLHMQDLMKANASINTNVRSKKLVEKLFDNPTDLQSNSTDDSNNSKFNSNIANSF